MGEGVDDIINSVLYELDIEVGESRGRGVERVEEEGEEDSSDEASDGASDEISKVKVSSAKMAGM